MIEMSDTVYDERTDGVMPIVAGVYPAHVSGFEAKLLNTKIGEQKVFNVNFQIAEDVDNMTIIKHEWEDEVLIPSLDSDGKEVKVSASFMKGKRFNSRGIWLTENPAEGEGWRNRTYVEFFEGLGVAFPKTKEGKTQLAEVEESDVIGQPALVKINREVYTNKEGEERSVWKVFTASQWKDGERLSPEEVGDDVPF